MASPTQWTGFWVNSGRWRWTGRPGLCSPWGHRVGHDLTTERRETLTLLWEKEWSRVSNSALISKRGSPGLRGCSCPSPPPGPSGGLGSSLLTAHLQVLQHLHGAKDLHLGAGVVVAQEDFGLVGVKPRAEGHLGPDLLRRGGAAREGSCDQQRRPLQAQVPQLLVRQPEHRHRADVPACGDRGAVPPGPRPTQALPPFPLPGGLLCSPGSPGEARPPPGASWEVPLQCSRPPWAPFLGPELPSVLESSVHGLPWGRNTRSISESWGPTS